MSNTFYTVKWIVITDVDAKTISHDILTNYLQHCHTFYNMECVETTIKKTFRYQKKVCDQTINQQQCMNVPVTDCQVGTTANCRMVPRQVCQDTCSDSPMCQQCDTFRNEPGYGSCGTSTCGVYLPSDPFMPNVTGGQGYFPGGVGGDGYFPGVSVGGEGFYPGTGGIGGEGFYPGTGGIGGEGFYPGTGEIGGEGFYPGTGGIGGEGFYPGGSEDGPVRPPYENPSRYNERLNVKLK